MSESPVGVLLMAYGTPAGVAEIESYYTHIRRGRPPSPEQLAELQGRYEAIGGSSPLLEISRAQAAGLQEALNAETDGDAQTSRCLPHAGGRGSQAGGRFHVQLGMKHAPPFIEDGMARLLEQGAERVVGLVLAPHYSALSVGEYIARAREAAAGRVALSFVESWHLMPSYISLLSDRVREALQTFPASARERVDVVFTAHSLPERVLQSGDPYPQQLRQTAENVARQAGLHSFSVAWQSAGRTAERWIGPDILDVVRSLAGSGSEGVLVCPAGFTSDHLEILYDLDVQCAELAQQLGIRWGRTISPNAEQALLAGLAGVVHERVLAGVA